MPRRRVVITGLGPVTPIGTGAEGLWEGLRRERSAVRTLTRFDPALWRSRNAGEVAGFDGADYLEAKRVKRLDRFGQFTVVAAQLALADAGVDLAREDRERVGAMMGTALGGVGFAEAELTKYVTEGCAPSTRRSRSTSSAARRAATWPSSTACTAPTRPTG